MAKNRNLTFDLMKGIAIVIMMIVHLVYNDSGPVAHFCYTFHMPLFFILAGFFAKELSDIPSFKQYTIKNAKRLLLPFVVTMLLRCAWGGAQAYFKHDIAYLLQPTLSMLVASPDGWETQWGLVYTGPMWFLIALFWLREMFYGLQYILKSINEQHRDILILAISIGVSIISVIVYPHLPSMPFCIMQAFTAIAFYALGWYVHKHPMPWWVYAICVVVWPFAICYGGVQLAFCGLKYYPLSFIGACGGTYVVYLICEGLVRGFRSIHFESILKPLSWGGINSLAILCMHEFEMYTAFIYSIKIRIPEVQYLIGWGEVFIAILLAYIVIKLPYIRKVYS